MTPKAQETRKNRDIELHQNENLLCNKGHLQENEKTRMEEKNCKLLGKGQVSRICKELFLGNKKAHKSIEKGQRTCIDFSPEQLREWPAHTTDAQHWSPGNANQTGTSFIKKKDNTC